MLLQAKPPLHLTYCLNIHPGQRWTENFQAIRGHACRVRDQLAGGKPFGLGLRLSAQAAEELSHPARLAEFRQFLAAQNLYVFTINGFPFGQFHGTAVKEDVYRPDWQDDRRRQYTIQLADILAELLPEAVEGSISTVPCSYKAWITQPAQVAAMANMLADVAAHLAEIRQKKGRDICLALEPEPDCYLETTAEVIDFFNGPLMEHGVSHLLAGGMHSRGRLCHTKDAAEECLRRHLGVCLDTAHAAVEFEDPAECLRQYHQAGIRIGKVQLSAALSLPAAPEALARLGEFGDAVYLHQVKARTANQTLLSFPDLPPALTDERLLQSPGGQLRVHFHVPLFCDPHRQLESTARLLGADFWQLLRSGLTSHAEIETYTFGVLPKQLQTADVAESIVREYRWVLEKQQAAGDRHQ